jgi:RNA polymerase sigma-70 factor, ECF subfamily
METVSTSSSLLARVKSRRPEAWLRLVELYAPLVYQWCRQSSLQPEDAADVGQEVFAAVDRGIAEFRRERPGDSFRGWLWTITRNKIRDHFRRHNKEHVQAQGGSAAQQRLAEIPDQPPTAAPSAGADGDHALERRALELVRATVEERTWQAFLRVTVDRQTPADVADELGMSVQAVYVAVHRVRRKLREELDGLMG